MKTTMIGYFNGLRFKTGLLYLKTRTNCKSALNKLKHDVSGMGTIEIIIIIAVLVALALIFRNFITALAQKIFNKIQEKTDTAIDDL